MYQYCKMLISITSTEFETCRYVDYLITYSEMSFPVSGVVVQQYICVVSISARTVEVCVLVVVPS